MVVRGQEVKIGASLGVTIVDETSASDALRTADLAMYEVKRRGGRVWMTATA
jgi:GGDEF domain-containing protein